MTHPVELARFLSALIRLLAIYLAFNGFTGIVPNLTYLIAWRSQGGVQITDDWVGSLLNFAEELVILGLLY